MISAQDRLAAASAIQARLQGGVRCETPQHGDAFGHGPAESRLLTAELSDGRFRLTRRVAALRLCGYEDPVPLSDRQLGKRGALHLHNKQAMNWGRDLLTMSDTTLTVVRDLEPGGGSSSRTLKYTKTG